MSGSDDDFGWDLFGGDDDVPAPPPAGQANSLAAELPFADGLFDEAPNAAAAAPRAPPSRVDEDEGLMEEDRMSRSDDGSDDGGSNQGDQEANADAEELEYTPNNLAKIFSTTETEFNFLYGQLPSDYGESSAAESIPATMQKIVALVSHEAFLPQRSEWIGMIMNEIVTLAGSNGAQPYQALMEERAKSLDSTLSQVSQQLEKRKGGSAADEFPELPNYEIATPTGILSRLPLHMSLSALAIVASSNAQLAVQLANGVTTSLQGLRIGALAGNSTAMADLREFLYSLRNSYAVATDAWIAATVALAHVALISASLNHILALATELSTVKHVSPIKLPLGALLNKLTLIANELHASFGSAVPSDTFSSSNCNRTFESFNGAAIADRDAAFERNTNWERGSGCAFCTMPLPSTPVAYFELSLISFNEPPSDMCMGLVEGPTPPPFIPLGGRVGSYLLWSSGLIQAHGVSRQYCAPWKRGDIIGCGYHQVMRHIFFTINGVYQGPAFTDVDPNAAYHPAMMLTHRGVKVRPRMQLSHQFVAPGVGVIPERTLRRAAIPVPEKVDELVEAKDVAKQLIDRIALVCSAVYTKGFYRSTISEWPLLIGLKSSTFANLRLLSKDETLLPDVLDILQLQLFFLGLAGRNTDKILPPAEVKEWRARLEDLVFNRNPPIEGATTAITNGFDVVFANEQATFLPRLISISGSDADASRSSFIASLIARTANHAAVAPLVENAQASPNGCASLMSLVKFLLDSTLKVHLARIDEIIKGAPVEIKQVFSNETKMLIAIIHTVTARFVSTSPFFAQFATALLRSVKLFFDPVLAYMAVLPVNSATVKNVYSALRTSPVFILGQLCGYFSHSAAAVLASGPELIEAAYEALRVVDRWNKSLHAAGIELQENDFVALQKELFLVPFNAIEATFKKEPVATTVDSLLFSAGLEPEWLDKDVPAAPVAGDAFLQEIIEQRGAGGEFEQKLRRFALLGSAGSQAMSKAVTHTAVDAACRALLAALLKHEDMVVAARFFLTDETKSPPERRLQLAYKTAVRVKRSLLMLHQTRVGAEKEYEVLAAAAISRAALVLALHRPQQVPGFAAKRSIRRSSQARGEETLSPVAELIADFVCGEVAASSVVQQLRERRARGLTRAVALATIERALTELAAPAFAEFFTTRHIGRVLRTKEAQTMLPHYLDQLNGAGADVGNKIQSMIFSILRTLLTRRVNEKNASLQGILHSFAIKWSTEADFTFLSQVGVLAALNTTIQQPAENIATSRTARKLALRTLELLALSACRGAKKAEDGEIGPAQLNFLQLLVDRLFENLTALSKKDAAFAALDGSSLLFNSIIFLDLLSGSPASRLVLNHPRWLGLLSALVKDPIVPQQLAVLRILRRLLPLHAPVVLPPVKSSSGSFKFAISEVFSSAVPKGATSSAAASAAPQQEDNNASAMSVCEALLTLAGGYLASPGTDTPWDQQGVADLAISVLRAVLLTPQWRAPLSAHLCSLISKIAPLDPESSSLNAQVAALAVLGGHLLRPRLGQRADSEKFSKAVITSVKPVKVGNAFEVEVKTSTKETLTLRHSTVDITPDFGGSLTELHEAIAQAIPPSSAAELLTALLTLLQGLHDHEKATAQSKLHAAHFLLKLQASQALQVILRQPSTVDAFIGLGCSPVLLMLALDQWKSLEYPPVLLVRFATELEMRGIKIKPTTPSEPVAKPVAAHLTTGAKPSALMPSPKKPVSDAKRALLASTEGVIVGSLFDDLELPPSPARITVPEKKEEVKSEEKKEDEKKDEKKEDDKKGEEKKDGKKGEEKNQMPLNWEVTFAKARYFERSNNAVPKHDVPQATPQNLIKARDALAGYYARQAVICILEAWLAAGRESPSAIAAFVQPARLLDLFAAMFNVSKDPNTDHELIVLRNVMLHFLRSKVALGGDKPLDHLILAAVFHYLQEKSAAGAVHSNISRATWLLDTLVEAGEVCSVWPKLHDASFFEQLVTPFATAHGNDSMQLGTVIAKLLTHKPVWRSPPPIELLRPLYKWVHARYYKETGKSRKIYTRQLQRLSELLIPLINKSLEVSAPRETLTAEKPDWLGCPSKRAVACTGTYSIVPGVSGADFARDSDGLVLEPKISLMNRMFSCQFRTPLSAVKGEFNTLLYTTSMDRLVAARKGQKGLELGVWRNEPATWHGSGFMLDKLDDGWHFFIIGVIKNKTCLWVDGRLVGNIAYAPTLPVGALGNALPTGGEQWGAVTDAHLPAFDVKDPTSQALLTTSSESASLPFRVGPPRVALLPIGSSDSTLSERVISSGAQQASYYGNCVLNAGVWTYSVELLTDGPITVGLASADIIRSVSNRAAFSNDANCVMFESGSGVAWHQGDRATGAKKFKKGDVVGISWVHSGKHPMVELWVNGTSSFSLDWNNFQPAIGVVPLIGLGANQVVAVNFSNTFGKKNAHAMDIHVSPPRSASLDNVAPEFRDLAVFEATARALLAGTVLPASFAALLSSDSTTPPAAITPLPLAQYITLMEVVNTITDGRNYMPTVLGQRGATAIAEHRHGISLASLPPAQLQLHYTVVRRFSLLAKTALPFIDFSLVSSPHSLAHLLTKVKQLIFSPLRVSYFTSVVHLLVAKSGAQKEIVLDRLRAAKAESDPTIGPEATFFGQGYTQLHFLPINDLTSSNKQTWTCKFKGEGAIDHGGPYRESISRFCSDLQSTYLGLFIKCPNAVHAIGVNREKWIPNPTANSRTQLDMFKFAGKLLGVAIFKNNMLGLDLPSIVWKFLVGDKLDRVDLEAIDRFSVQSLKEMLSDNITADIFDSVFPGLNFTTQLSNGDVVELVPRGKDLPVTYENRNEYAALVLERRLNECTAQLEALREGLGTMVCLDSLSVLTWEELECAVCGNEDFDVEALKKRTILEFPPKAVQLEWFWKALASFTPKQKASFLRFVWGQSRLPASFRSEKMKIIILAKAKPDEAFPESHTCFFELSLPLYTSEKILREKLLYAITTVTGIDGDGGDLMEDRNNPNTNNAPSLW